jgi:hypothetical protein
MIKVFALSALSKIFAIKVRANRGEELDLDGKSLTLPTNN